MLIFERTIYLNPIVLYIYVNFLAKRHACKILNLHLHIKLTRTRFFYTRDTKYFLCVLLKTIVCNNLINLLLPQNTQILNHDAFFMKFVEHELNVIYQLSSKFIGHDNHFVSI